MKRLFAETNAGSMVLFVDSKKMAYIVEEKSFDERLTLEVAKAADYSNLDNCPTAQDCKDSMTFGVIVKFNPDDFETITEF